MMVNIEEFKLAHKDKLLTHTFKHQFGIWIKFEYELEYTNMQMNNYCHDIPHALEQELDKSVISHMTYNLCVQMLHCYKRANEHYETSNLYLVDYGKGEVSLQNINEFQEHRKNIKERIKKLNDISIFESFKSTPGDSFKMHQLQEEQESKVNPLISLERRLAYMNGVQLFDCLLYLINLTENKLLDIRNGITYETNEFLEHVYYLNYVFFADYYWVNERDKFRKYVVENELLDDVTLEGLRNYYKQLLHDFKTNEIGLLWEKYSEEKSELAYELRCHPISEEQWTYFFRTIFKLEEIKRWINELKHPIQNNDKDYPVSVWDKIFKDVIDVSKIKSILPQLLSNKIDIPNCFIAHRILEEIEWLDDEMDVHFINWIKDVYGWEYSTEHFKSINSAFKNTHSLDWNAKTITSAKIAINYKNMADKIRNEFVVMDGRSIKSDNTYYFKKPDLYIEHKKNP